MPGPFITKRRMLQILTRSSGSDRTSRICDRFLSTMILLNLLAVSLESIDTLSAAYGNLFFVFEMVSVAIFGVEYLLRIWCMAANDASRHTSGTRRRLEYVFSFTGLIDLVAILPSLLPLILGEVDLRWLRVLRLVRLLKISHYSTALEDLIAAVRSESSAFGAALYLFFIALFASSSLMYVVEHHAQPENFASIPRTSFVCSLASSAWVASAAPLAWEFSQVFGEEQQNAAEQIQEGAPASRRRPYGRGHYRNDAPRN